jgi:type I restriction enzyme, R subunit
VVTDRTELDDQIATTYTAMGALGPKKLKDAQAQSRTHLRELLSGNERYVFTLIHKFGTERGEPMPVLSDRSDIIVITDEAHRSQYDQLAANMRRALPNAAFLGFTGTPLMAGEERTKRSSAITSASTTSLNPSQTAQRSRCSTSPGSPSFNWRRRT